MTNNIIRGLLPDGHAPSVLREEILSLIKSNTPAQGTSGGPTTTVTTGAVTLGAAASAAFEVLGDVSYAPGITWLGRLPRRGGFVSLDRRHCARCVACIFWRGTDPGCSVAGTRKSGYPVAGNPHHG